MRAVAFLLDLGVNDPCTGCDGDFGHRVGECRPDTGAQIRFDDVNGAAVLGDHQDARMGFGRRRCRRGHEHDVQRFIQCAAGGHDHRETVGMECGVERHESVVLPWRDARQVRLERSLRSQRSRDHAGCRLRKLGRKASVDENNPWAIRRPEPRIQLGAADRSRWRRHERCPRDRSDIGAAPGLHLGGREAERDETFERRASQRQRRPCRRHALEPRHARFDAGVDSGRRHARPHRAPVVPVGATAGETLV